MMEPGEQVVKPDQCWWQGYGLAWFVQELTHGGGPRRLSTEVAQLARWTDTGEGFSLQERAVPVESLLNGDGGWREVTDPAEVERQRTLQGQVVHYKGRQFIADRPLVTSEGGEGPAVIGLRPDAEALANHPLMEELREAGERATADADAQVDAATTASELGITSKDPEVQGILDAYVEELKPVVKQTYRVGVDAAVDGALHGVSFIGPDGERIDPATVMPVSTSVDPATGGPLAAPRYEQRTMVASTPTTMFSPSTPRPRERRPMTVSYAWSREAEEGLIRMLLDNDWSVAMPTVHGAPTSFYEHLSAAKAARAREDTELVRGQVEQASGLPGVYLADGPYMGDVDPTVTHHGEPVPDAVPRLDPGAGQGRDDLLRAGNVGVGLRGDGTPVVAREQRELEAFRRVTSEDPLASALASARQQLLHLRALLEQASHVLSGPTFTAWHCMACGRVVSEETILEGWNPKSHVTWYEVRQQDGGGFRDLMCWGPDGDGHEPPVGRAAQPMHRVECRVVTNDKRS